MSLSSELLATDLEERIDKLKSTNDPAIYKKQYYLALSTAIIEHIQTNAVVSTIVTGEVSAGTTKGEAVAGKGKGTVS